MANPTNKQSPLLLTAVLASAVSSICCFGPFVLLATGLSGAWMSRMMAVEPFQPYLVGLSIILVAIAGWQLRSQPSCELDAGEAAVSTQRTLSIVGYGSAFLLVVIFASSEYWIPIVAG